MFFFFSFNLFKIVNLDTQQVTALQYSPLTREGDPKRSGA